MSMRDQERRQKEAERRMNAVMRRADRVVRGVLARQKEADRRAKEVLRRVERGDVQPRPLPGVREDSLESSESMESMGSMEPSESMPSAGTVSSVTGESEAAGMQEDMLLQDAMPYDPEKASQDLAQRVTDDTGTGGDPHQHNERKAEEMEQKMSRD